MRKEPEKIDQLPDEVLMHIFTFLELASIANAAITQRRWHRLLRDESFWISLLLKDFASFHSSKADIKKVLLSPDALYKKEYKMKIIIKYLISGKTIPKPISEDDSIWESLCRRIYPSLQQQGHQWKQSFLKKSGDLRMLTNQIHLLVRSGYADILKSYIEIAKNTTLTIQLNIQTKQSWWQRISGVKVINQSVEITFNELINYQSDKTATPLFIASKYGHYDIVKLLLANEADVNQITTNIGTTALHAAAEFGHLAISKLLIEYGANINQAGTNQGFTPLIYSVINGHLAITEFLLANGARVNQTLINGLTALHAAAQFGHPQIAKLLIEHHANVNQASAQTGLTPLIHAAMNGHLAITKLLIKNNAKVNHATSDGLNALITATNFGHFDIVKLLIDNHANVNHENYKGETPLFIAENNSHFEIVKFLINHHANVDHAAQNGETTLLIAVKMGHYEIAKLLIDHHANVNKATIYGETPLQKAAFHGHKKITKLLVDHNANLDQVALNGSTPLFVAAQRGHYEIVKLLIDNHANVNLARTDTAASPLYIAACNDYKDIVKLLIQHGANYQQIPNELLDKYPKAKSCYHKAHAELLKEQQQSTNETEPSLKH